MKDYDKNKDSSYLKYQDVNDQYGWAISQKLLFNAFKSVEETSQFNEDFMKSYNEDIDDKYIFEFDVQYPQKLHDLHLLILLQRIKTEKVEKPLANLHEERIRYSHEKFKTRIKLSVSFKKTLRSHWV